MLSKEDWMSIQAQHARGVYQKDIAAALGVHPRTVRRALARSAAPSAKRRGARGSLLDPYKPLIDELLRSGVWNAQVILRELQARGYSGQKTIVRDYIHPKRPLRQERATVRFETAPGEQLQNDWGSEWTQIGGETCQVHFAVNTLGFSRRFHFWVTDSEDAEHTYEGLIRAFEHFGGVAAEVLVDNQKSCVIEHRIGDRVRFNPRFVDLAGHYDFRPRACRPYRARTKGKDERNVGYVKGNFFVRYRSFESYAHLNQLAERWLAEEADPRVHGTVKEVVAERFAREAPHLAPLPATRFDTSYLEHRLVAWDGYVEVRGNRYAVPDTHVAQRVRIRISLEGLLAVYDESTEQKLIEHPLRPASEGWATVPGVHQRLWRQAFDVERRDLAVYEEVARCSS